MNTIVRIPGATNFFPRSGPGKAIRSKRATFDSSRLFSAVYGGSGDFLGYVDQRQANRLMRSASARCVGASRNRDYNCLVLLSSADLNAIVFTGNSRDQKLHYFEKLSVGQMHMIKRLSRSGEFKAWNGRESFTDKRFNPDRIPRPLYPSVGAFEAARKAKTLSPA